MAKLAYLGVNESLSQTACTSFVESDLTFQLTTTYKQLSANDLNTLISVTKTLNQSKK